MTLALDKLSLARVFLNYALTEIKEKYIIFTKTYLSQAIPDFREAGRQDLLPLGLFTRAQFYRVQNDFLSAWDDLEEAREIAERGDMKLWLVDYHLEAVRAFSCQLSANGFQLIENGREVTLSREEMMDRMKMHVEQADKLVQETGYHRRDPEVELGYAGLFFAQGEQAKAREHLARGKKLLDKMGIRCWDFWVREMDENVRGR